jgi:hypothetical protein
MTSHMSLVKEKKKKTKAQSHKPGIWNPHT